MKEFFKEVLKGVSVELVIKLILCLGAIFLKNKKKKAKLKTLDVGTTATDSVIKNKLKGDTATGSLIRNTFK